MSNLTDIVHSATRLTFDIGVAATEALIYYYVPFLAASPFKQIIHYLITKFSDALFVELDRFGFFAIVDFETDQQRDEAKKAADNLKKLILPPKGKQDAAAVQKAKEEFKNRYGNLIRIKP